MPKPPRFATETAQKTAVGVVTFLVLCVALAVAQFYTQAHQLGSEVAVEPGRVEALIIDLPRGWTRESMTENGPGFSGKPARLWDPAVKGRELVVGRVDVAAPSGPHAVLRGLLDSVTGSHRGMFVDKAPPRRFRAGAFACVFYHGQRQMEEDGLAMHDWVVVMTEDGRRHWMILLTTPLSPDADAIAANEQLILRIAAGAKDTAFRPADPGFLDLTRLDAVVPAIAPRIDAGTADAPIHIALTGAATPHLGLLRIRRVIDPQIAQPKAPLSPAAGLRREFLEVHGREPDAAELTTGLLEDATVTRLKLSAGKDGELAREFHYISGAEGLLIEVLAEPESLQATLAMIAQVYHASRPSSDGPVGEIADATKRGQSLAAAQRKLMTTQFAPATRHYKISRDGHIIGTQIEEAYHRPAADLPLRTRAVRTLSANGRLSTAESQWLASPDGDRIDNTSYTEIKDGMTERSFAYQMSLRDRKLSMSTLPPKVGRDPIWTDATPEGYLPGMVEGRWMWHELEPWTTPGPALIWRSNGLSPPAPYWLEVRRIERGTLLGKAAKAEAAGYNLQSVDAVAFVTIRPMMGMDGECYWLAADGRILRSQWHETVRSPAGGARLTSEVTDARTVVAIVPRNRDILKLWQQEGTRDD